MTMKIGILQTDAVSDRIHHISGGDYPEMFERLFKTCCNDFSCQVFDVTSGELPQSVDECHGYLITGSKVGVYDDQPWIPLLKKFILDIGQTQKPLIGICFGHQLIAETFGGKVEKSPKGWGVGMHYVKVESQKEWMNPHADQCGLVFSHQDQVMLLPKNAEILASSEFCPIQMFCIDDHILGMQFHPEMNKEHSQILLKMFCSSIGPVACARAVTSLNNIPNDGKIIGQWMANFFGINNEST